MDDGARDYDLRASWFPDFCDSESEAKKLREWIDRIRHAIRNEPNFKALFSAPAAVGAPRALSQTERIRLRNHRNRFFFLFFPLAVLFMELVFHFALYGELPVRNLIYITLFSFAYGFFVNFLALLMPLRVNRGFTLGCLIFTTLLFESQYVYFRFFKAFYRVSMVGMAGNALRDFWRETLSTISSSWFGIVLMFLPLIYFVLHYKKYAPSFAPTMAFRLYLVIAALLLQLLGAGLVSLDRSDFGDRYYYKNEFSPTEAVKRYGLMTNMRLDFGVLLFGEPDKDIGGEVPGEIVNPFESDKPESTTPEGSSEAPDTSDTTEPVEPPKPIEYGDNVMDIDFASLIANEENAEIRGAHEYFSSLAPTKKNKYTGMFEGKNLIFLTLEGFSYKTIDKERTPTLYKMATEGFVFNNFYTSLWGGSTATGEYTAMTGLFHNSAKCLENSAKNLMYFTMGNQLSRLGYKTYAFHNHFYTYYGRDKSHPNMGYEFIAINHGLEGLTDCWPRSDYEMAVATLPYYLNLEEPFHAYYMTVSGHANYSFIGNNMSKKHKDVVADLPCSDNVKAYHACQYEVELMLAEMVRQLEAAGKLEDTVFVMSADHYPYALTDSELSELYGIPADGIHKNFDLLRNGLIIWSASMEEPVVVDTPCSSLDIIPTVSNLFGLSYDSRLLMGTDVLSDSVPLVILNCDGDGSSWNWLNKYGVYNSGTRTFTAYPGFEATEEEIAAYVKQMNRVVSLKNKYAHLILEKDYYRYLFG